MSVDCFEIKDLIKDLPGGYEYSSVCVFEKHIYIGTNTGDLFHYMDINDLEYVLVSKINYNEALPEDEGLQGGITDIHVVRSIKKALVLTSIGLVFIYDLPELQCAREEAIMQNIKSIGNYSATNDNELIFINTNNEGTVYSIETDNSIVKQNAHVFVEHVQKIIMEKDLALIVNNEGNFELLQLPKNKTSKQKIHHIPLFKAFEIADSLNEGSRIPVATSMVNNCFLVVCGSTPSEPSMAMIIDHEGNIINGTIVLEKGYPLDVLVEGNHAFFQFDDCIQVFELGKEESTLVQEIEKEKICYSLFELSINSHAKDTEVVDKLKLVPLAMKTEATSAISIRQEQEELYVSKLYNKKTQLLLFNDEGVKTLVEKPYFLKFQDFSEKSLVECKDFLTQQKTMAHSKGLHFKFLILQNTYIETYYLLLLLLHSESLDVEFKRELLDRCITVDMRLVYYILGFPVYGDLWLFNGLIKITEKLKILKLLNKFKEPLSFLQNNVIFLNDKNSSLKDSVRDFLNVNRTVTMGFVKYWAEGKIVETLDFKSVDIEMFGDEILELLLKQLEILDQDSKNDNNMSREKKIAIQNSIKNVYLSKNRFDEYLDILLKDKDYRQISEFSVDNFNHVKNKILKKKAIIILLNNLEKNSNITTKDDEIEVLNKIIEIINNEEAFELDDVLLEVKDLSINIYILEKELTTKEDSVDDIKNSHVLLEYYITQIKDILLNQGLLDDLNKYQISYTQDMNYLEKIEFHNYLLKKLDFQDDGNENRNINFRELKTKICKLQEKNDQVFQTVVENFRDYVPVLLLLIEDNSDRAQYIGHREAFDMCLVLNDFKTINNFHLATSTFMEIFKNYLAVDPTSSVALRFLDSNHQLVARDKYMCLELLREIPGNWKNCTISKFLHCSVLNIKIEAQRIELEKSLLKQQLSERKKILRLSNKTK